MVLSRDGDSDSDSGRLLAGPRDARAKGRTGEGECGGAGGPATHAQRSSAVASWLSRFCFPPTHTLLLR